MDVMTDTRAVIDATRIAALEADGAAARKRVADLLERNASLLEALRHLLFAAIAEKHGIRVAAAMHGGRWRQWPHDIRFVDERHERARALLAERPTP